MKILQNFNLEKYNSYRVKATCSEVYFPDTEEDIASFFLKNKEFIVLGNGNNIILSKPHYDIPVLIFNGSFNKVMVENDTIIAESGATLQLISELAHFHSLQGMEFLYDIPSSVGGALVMNAGTKEGTTSDIVSRVRVIDQTNGQIFELSKDELNFSYRNSLFQNNPNIIVLKVWFQLSKGNQDLIWENMVKTKARRWQVQPRDLPNCGSVFKRPEGRFVGPMLDELGLKGHTIGGAQVSTKHSGFIVNIGEATGQDILALIQYIQQKVNNQFGVMLEVEQKII